MSTASTQSKGIHRRLNSLQSNGRSSSHSSRRRRRLIPHNEAYTFALRVAFLSYLLQPRARRLQHVPAPHAQITRASSSINDLMKDFTHVQNSSSTRFPRGFMAELEKKLTGVLMGKERRPEYNDPVVKRTFAVFYTAFTEHSFRKRMEQDRRVEDLVLIFFSSATKELQKGKAAGDDAWKLMVDRHVALFVRLISSTLRDHDWVRERPELTSRLATLESKLLKHDQDLADASQRAGGAGGTSVEVEVPLSYEVKDMPLVLVVGRIFGLTNAQMQSDINKNKAAWTDKAALQDLKTYQNFLNLNSTRTLRSEDFDTEEAYEAWRNAEGPELSQMMLAILQVNPLLAKSAPGGGAPHSKSASKGSILSDSGYSDGSRKFSDHSENGSSYVLDQPVDMSSLHLEGGNSDVPEDAENPFTYIPSDPRAFYRFVLMQALTYDLREQAQHQSEDASPTNFLSKQSIELLNECCVRWRIPPFSRVVLFLDVIKEKYVDQEIDLDALDAALNFVKEPHPEPKKSSTSHAFMPALFDRSRWTIADFATNRQILSDLYRALLRDLYDLLMRCYETKQPPIGPIMYVLENHILEDALFSKGPEESIRFAENASQGLRQRASDVYANFLSAEIPNAQEEWDFYHVIQLGKAILKLAERIKKRYRKNPEIMG